MMKGVINMTNKKRVGIQLNEIVYDKLKEIAGRYGMTVNSLMAYILGQWADSNYDMKERVAQKFIQEIAKEAMNKDKNPMVEKIIKEMGLQKEKE